MMASVDAAMRHRNLLNKRDRLLVEAYHAFTHGDGATAERRALAFVDRYPDQVEGWWLLGVSRSWASRESNSPDVRNIMAQTDP